jgi:hypothetical protein
MPYKTTRTIDLGRHPAENASETMRAESHAFLYQKVANDCDIDHHVPHFLDIHHALVETLETFCCSSTAP